MDIKFSAPYISQSLALHRLVLVWKEITFSTLYKMKEDNDV